MKNIIVNVVLGAVLMLIAIIVTFGIFSMIRYLIHPAVKQQEDCFVVKDKCIPYRNYAQEYGNYPVDKIS
jgi:hypothetical protein